MPAGKAARDDYRISVVQGVRLTGAALARRHGMSERWGRDRIAEVRAQSNGNGDRPTAAASASGTGDAAASTAGIRDASAQVPAHAATGSSIGNGSRPMRAVPASGSDNTSAAPNGSVALPIGKHNGHDRTGGSLCPLPSGASGNGTAVGGGNGGAVAGNEPTSQGQGHAAEPVQRRITTAAVVIVALVTAAASYDHQRALAELAGEGWRSLLFPLSVDGLLTAATMLMLTRRRTGQRAGALTWVALTLGVTASVTGNVIGADPTIVDPVLVGRLVAAWPPVALFLSLELLLRQLGIRSDGDRP